MSLSRADDLLDLDRRCQLWLPQAVGSSFSTGGSSTVSASSTDDSITSTSRQKKRIGGHKKFSVTTPTSFLLTTALSPTMPGTLSNMSQYIGAFGNNAVMAVPRLLGLHKRPAADLPPKFDTGDWWRYSTRGNYKKWYGMQIPITIEKSLPTAKGWRNSYTHITAHIRCDNAKACRRECDSTFGPGDGLWEFASTGGQGWEGLSGILLRNKVSAYESCLHEVDKREKEAMRNYFEYWRGRQGPPCAGFCKASPGNDYMQDMLNTVIRWKRKSGLVKHTMQRLLSEVVAPLKSQDLNEMGHWLSQRETDRRTETMKSASLMKQRASMPSNMEVAGSMPSGDDDEEDFADGEDTETEAPSDATGED